MKIDYKKMLIGLAILIAALGIIKACEQEPKVRTVTETKYETVHDTIYNAIIEKVPTKVYVERYKTVKGKDSLIYVSEPSDSTLEANQYNTLLKANNATATLKITITGELLDVTGTIDYEKEITTTTITKSKAQSGLFIYGSMPINSVNPELGLMYQFKNSVMVLGAVQYNEFTHQADIKVGVGIKIFL